MSHSNPFQPWKPHQPGLSNINNVNYLPYISHHHQLVHPPPTSVSVLQQQQQQSVQQNNNNFQQSGAQTNNNNSHVCSSISEPPTNSSAVVINKGPNYPKHISLDKLTGIDNLVEGSHSVDERNAKLQQFAEKNIRLCVLCLVHSTISLSHLMAWQNRAASRITKFDLSALPIETKTTRQLNSLQRYTQIYCLIYFGFYFLPFFVRYFSPALNATASHQQ